MIVATTILALYLTSAAWTYWFVVSTSKVGMKPTRREIVDTMRREGWTLALMSLGWLPILIIGLVTSGIRARRESRGRG